MKTKYYNAKNLETLLNKQKIATIDSLKNNFPFSEEQ